MKNKIKLLAIGIIMALSQCLIAATWYVSPIGNNANSGATWVLAKKTIQAGVDMASGGDTVLVTNGTYVLTNQVNIHSGITVTSVNGANLTVVNGNYPVTTNQCFYLSSTNAILDGFTITNGYSVGGGAVYNSWGGTVQNCTISGNVGDGVYNYINGKALNCTISGNVGVGVKDHINGTVENCAIFGNADGGVQNYSTVRNCTIFGNTGGGVVYNGGTVQNCTISGNAGVGVRNDLGTVENCMISGNAGVGVDNYGTVENCTISGNTGVKGGGVYSTHGAVRNCTILGNSAPSIGGVYADNQTILENCIVFYNENGDLNNNYNFSRYSCAPGLSGNGNITAAPQFVDAASGNYRLQSTSPCINTGTNQDWMANAVDLDGNPRIINGRVDMGAYESSNAPVIGPVIKANGQADNVTVSHSSNLTVTVQINPGQYSGINADWWVVALANGSWYYLNSAVQWTPFNGVLANCHPVCQVPLFNLSATPVLSYTGLPVGSYTFWFVITQMDGVLDINEPMLFDSVNVIVQ